MDKAEGFQCLGPSNWTICSPLSQFCSEIFPISDFHTGECQFLYSPCRKWNSPNLSETQGFACQFFIPINEIIILQTHVRVRRRRRGVGQRRRQLRLRPHAPLQDGGGKRLRLLHRCRCQATALGRDTSFWPMLINWAR